MTQPQHNLPTQLTSFIGRESEIADIARLLDSARLITLTGPGGAGKTRLSIEVASHALGSYPDGVWVVQLDSLGDPALVVPTMAATLGLHEQPDLPLYTTLVEWLKTRKALLILDNCEHLVRACASLVDTLLRACPHLHILATSRQVLNISGETLRRVPSMSFPDPHHLPPVESLKQYEAVRLFVERAHLKQGDFKLTAENAGAVAQLCYALDGLPLALELAAARTSMLPVEEIAARLDERFHLLAGDNRTAPTRQQTLRGAIDWSYDLLSEAGQELLRGLSVFAGAFSLEAIEGVCMEENRYETIDLLAELVDDSLLMVEGRGGEVRYRLLDTIRQYAAMHLRAAGDEAAMRARHLHWYVELAEQAEANLQGAEQSSWLERLQADHDNFRAALQWSQSAEAENGVEAGLRLVKALDWFWYVRAHWTEGRRWLEAALALSEGLPTIPKDLRASASYGAALLARRQGDYDHAAILFTDSLELFRSIGDSKYVSATLSNLGVVATNLGDYAKAEAVLKESLVIKQELGDRNGASVALMNLANIATDQGDYALARRYLEESVAIQRASGNRNMLAISLNNLGSIARYLGETEKARSLVEEGLGIKRELGDMAEIASSLHKLAEIEWYNRHYAEAQSLCEEGMVLLEGVGDKESTALLLNMMGEIARCQSNYVEARARYEEALASSTARWIVPDALYNLAHAAQQEGDYAQVATSLKESLQAYMEIGAKRGISECLICAANMASAGGAAERAAQLFGAANALLEATGYQMHPSDQDELRYREGEVRIKLGKTKWKHAWGVGRDMATGTACELAMQVMQAVLEQEGMTARPKKGTSHAEKYPYHLTKREVEVLRLLATGLTDTQIAENLCLSRNTVHAHLRSIYGKLDVTTRAAAGHFAFDHNLV